MSIAGVATSVPVLTLLMLIAVDLLLRLGNPADALGYSSVDQWNLPPRIEACRRASPDVALLGSSLLLCLNQDQNGANFYNGLVPSYLQKHLRATTGQGVTCVNLCSGLQMISEGYLIATAATGGRDYPRVIVYGTALRDFIHDLFAREWSCESFASIAPYVPIKWDVLRVLSGYEARRELILCHFWYLYRDRTDFKNVLSAAAKNMLENLPLDQPFFRLGADHLWRSQRHGYLSEEWVPRKQEKFAEQVKRAHPEFLREYYFGMQELIYRQGSEATRALEARYMEALAALCREKGIKLVIVNMPLGPEIMTLVPPGLNDAYRGYLQALSRQYGVVLLDFYGDPEFTAGSFKDGLHLDYGGSVRLADRMIDALKTEHPEVLQAMAAHAARRPGFCPYNRAR